VLAYTLRNRWFALLVHGGLWLLLIATLSSLDRARIRYSQASTLTPLTTNLVPIARIEHAAKLFSTPRPPGADTNMIDPFFTRHFSPPVTPSPPPPTSRKIELIYQGFYETEGAPRHAFIRLGDILLAAPAGSNFAANLFISGMDASSLKLTNQAGQTSVLGLNVKKEVEVPAK
jgi:hypothetical protein